MDVRCRLRTRPGRRLSPSKSERAWSCGCHGFALLALASALLRLLRSRTFAVFAVALRCCASLPRAFSLLYGHWRVGCVCQPSCLSLWLSRSCWAIHFVSLDEFKPQESCHDPQHNPRFSASDPSHSDRPDSCAARLSKLPRRRARAGLGAIGAVLAASALAASTSAAATPPTVTETFPSTGAEQSFTVPPGVSSVRVNAIGAAGEPGRFGFAGVDGTGARAPTWSVSCR